MAIAYVTEFANPIVFQGNTQPVCSLQAITTQAVTYTGTAAASAALNIKTRMVRIHTDSICSFAYGTAPVALTTDPRMVAGQTEYFEVNLDRPLTAANKLSFIVNT